MGLPTRLEKFGDTKKNTTEKVAESTEKQILNEIDEQINKKLTNEDFIPKLGVYTFVSSPFSRVVIVAHDGVERGDLQMRYIPVRAYESILTGANLSNWRKSTPAEQDKIIEEANKRWNTKAQAEVDRLNKKEPVKKEEPKKATTVEISNNKDIVSAATSHMDKMLANKELFLSKFTEANGRA